MALSVGLDTAVKALRAHQLAVDIAAHNLANANTVGYSRQRVLLRPVGLTGSDFGGDSLLGRAGYGVDASDVNRVRDVFLDFQQRQAISQRTQAQAHASLLEKAELAFNDPTDDGLSAVLGEFWNAWHDVVNDPESSAARTTLVHTTTTLAARIQRAHNHLSAQHDDLDRQVTAIADKVNAITAEIAHLNGQIKQVELTGARANDLRDRRDLLLDQLAEVGNISYTEEEDTTVTVIFGDQELVSGLDATEVAVSAPPLVIVLADDVAVEVEVTAGRLRGLYDARADLDALIADLDHFAATLISEVNAVHETGFGLDGATGLVFFTGAGAADIGINAALVANPEKIGAAEDLDSPGNGAIALAIAQLQLATTIDGTTFDEYYANMVAGLGADVSRARGLASSSELLTNHLEALRQSVAGVSIDEEVANMTAAQYAYQAAARVITTIDQMLDTLINRTAV